MAEKKYANLEEVRYVLHDNPLSQANLLELLAYGQAVTVVNPDDSRLPVGPRVFNRLGSTCSIPTPLGGKIEIFLLTGSDPSTERHVLAQLCRRWVEKSLHGLLTDRTDQQIQDLLLAEADWLIANGRPLLPVEIFAYSHGYKGPWQPAKDLPSREHSDSARFVRLLAPQNPTDEEVTNEFNKALGLSSFGTTAVEELLKKTKFRFHHRESLAGHKETVSNDPQQGPEWRIFYDRQSLVVLVHPSVSSLQWPFWTAVVMLIVRQNSSWLGSKQMNHNLKLLELCRVRAIKLKEDPPVPWATIVTRF